MCFSSTWGNYEKLVLRFTYFPKKEILLDIVSHYPVMYNLFLVGGRGSYLDCTLQTAFVTMAPATAADILIPCFVCGNYY